MIHLQLLLERRAIHLESGRNLRYSHQHSLEFHL